MVNNKENLEKKITQAAEVYSKNIAIRSLITQIPYIGSPIDIFITVKAQKIFEERITAFLMNLDTEFSKLQSSVINYEYLDSEEFFDVFLKTYEQVLKTRSRLKLELFAKLIRGSVIIGFDEKFSSESYLYILSELTEKEFCIAKNLYKFDENSEKVGASKKFVVSEINKYLINENNLISEDELEVILIRLQSVGLLKIVLSGGGSGFNAPPTSYCYSITQVCKKLMKFLE